MTDLIQADQLRLLIERIERLSEEKQGIADDIKDELSADIGIPISGLVQISKGGRLRRQGDARSHQTAQTG